MKMDFSKFKKISSDSKSTTLKHPEGHKIVVAHHALSPELRKEIDAIPNKYAHNYAQGGEVEDVREPASVPKNNRTPEESAKRFGMDPQMLAEIQSYPTNATQQASPIPTSEAKVDSDLAKMGRDPQAVGDGAQLTPEELALTSTIPKMDEPAAHTSISNYKIPDAAQPLPSDVGGSAMPGDALPAGINQIPAAPGFQMAPQDPYGRATNLQNTVGGVNQQEQAIQDQAAIQKQQSRLQDTNEVNQITKLQDLQNKFQDTTNEYTKNQEALLHDYAAGHINPNRLFENQTSGQKVMGAIGLILGGIGGAMTGQGNPTLDFINRQIDRDVDAQKANMDKQHNLFGANMALYGNEKDAYTATKAAMADIYSHVAQKQAMQAAGPMAQARANQLTGELKAKTAPEVANMLQNQAVIKMLNGENPGGGQAPTMDPSSKIAMMSASGWIKPEQAQKMTEDLQRAQEFKQVRETAFKGFDTVKRGNKVGYLISNPSLIASGAVGAQMNAAIAMLAKDTAGRYNEEEANSLKAQFKPSIYDSPQAAQMKLNAFSDYINTKSNFPSLDPWGINPLKQGPQAGQPAPRFGANGQKTLPDLGPVARPKKK